MIAKCNRLLPWYAKVKARHALEFKDQVEKLHHRLMADGIIEDALLILVEGRDAKRNIKIIASKLWEAAYTISEKNGR